VPHAAAEREHGCLYDRSIEIGVEAETIVDGQRCTKVEALRRRGMLPRRRIAVPLGMQGLVMGSIFEKGPLVVQRT
jgi:hypothetical protein